MMAARIFLPRGIPFKLQIFQGQSCILVVEDSGCRLEINVYCLDITASFCCFLFGPSLTSVLEIKFKWLQRVETVSSYTAFNQFEMRWNVVSELTVQTCRSHMNLISSTG